MDAHLFGATTRHWPFQQRNRRSLHGLIGLFTLLSVLFGFFVAFPLFAHSSPVYAAGGLQLNAGGPAVAPFAADADFSGGATAATSHAIDTSTVSSPAPQAVYQSNRYGNFSYSLPGLTPNAAYTLRLHFAEEYWTAAGLRLFNVSLNGTQILSNFDIFASAGAEYKAIVEQFTATATNSGTLNLQFSAVKDNAQVNGIEVLGGTSPTPTPTSTPAVTPTSTLTGGVQINAGGSAASPFSADTAFTGGATAGTTSTITTTGVSNPAPQAVYQSNRYGNFTYTIPNLTPGAAYTVRLHFAETYWTAAGKRTFNVSLNSTQVLTNFDIFVTAGGEYRAVVEQFSATATNGGAITIQFTSVVDNAQVNGIEVLGSSSTPTPTPTLISTPTPTSTPVTGPTGTFPLILQNNTRGTWSNSQVYIMVLGQATPGQWFYLKADGTLAHINHLDANAPNHLTKNGVNYANMAFTLAQASTVTMPTRLEGARIYISLGSPMYIPISSDDSGWGGPNLLNPSDPNADVYFDWYEFTYSYGAVPFGGNTTQVDEFGLPLTAHLQQSASGFDQTNGITLTRAQIFSQYSASVAPAFQGLANPYRIVAPRSSQAFMPGGSQANYMQAYIDQTWNYYTANQFSLTSSGTTFTGKVINSQLQFTSNGAGPFVLNKPTTTDVFQCSGALASGGMTTQELALGADFCAAFNRGVAMNTADWANPATYYTGSIKNDYAMFWHQISINNKAYSFAYDDVNSQSSVAILSNANPPTALTLGIGW